MEASDSEAVAMVRAGDIDAYRILVDRHSRNVFRLAYRMTGSRQDSEDIVQEAFLRAFRRLRDWDGRASFSTWLHRIAANYALDLLRRRKKFAEAQISSVEEFPLSSPDPGPDRVLASGDMRTRIEQTLAGLSPQERTAFVMRHYEGLSIGEISAALGLSANAAKHSIFRAVQKLRRALEPFVDTVHAN